MVNHIVLEIIAEIGRWEINLYAYLWESSLYQFKRRNKVTVCADEGNNVSRSQNTILNHSDWNVDIRFLFFGALNISFAVWADNMLFKILVPDNFKPVSVYQFIGIKKSTLTAIFLRTERGCREINDFFKHLPGAKKTLAQLHHINPIEPLPCRINTFSALETEIEIEAIYVECHSFGLFHVVK